MMYKLFETLFPPIWLGGILFLLGYYAWTNQFDLLFLTIITSLNFILVGTLNKQITKK